MASIDLTPTGKGREFGDGSAITGTTNFTRTDGLDRNGCDAVLASDGTEYTIQRIETANADGSTTTRITGTTSVGVQAFVNEETISANGLVRTIRFDDNADGVFDRSMTETRVNNANGSHTLTTNFFNADGTVAFGRVVITSANGNSIITDVDNNGDGIADQRQIYVRNVARRKALHDRSHTARRCIQRTNRRGISEETAKPGGTRADTLERVHKMMDATKFA